MTVAKLISKSVTHWQLHRPSLHLHMTYIWAYKTRVQLAGFVCSVCGWRAQSFLFSFLFYMENRSGPFVSEVKFSNFVFQIFQGLVLWSFLCYAMTSPCCPCTDCLCFCVRTVGWMRFSPAWTTWAQSRQQTSTAWRSSSSTMTSTIAGTWQQRLTGTMRTVRHVSLNGLVLRPSQVCYTSVYVLPVLLVNVHPCTCISFCLKHFVTIENKSVTCLFRGRIL